MEIFGTEKGPFNQEFWIKTEPLQRVHVKGRFIEAGLTVDYPLSDKNLMILNFPRSFVGVEHQRNVIMQNHSCCSAVVCVIGRANKILMVREKIKLNIFHKFADLIITYFSNIKMRKSLMLISSILTFHL